MSRDGRSEPTRTQVAIVGAGPAGLLLANVLTAAGIDCVVVEHRSREHIESRARAGFLEQRTLDCLSRHGLAERLTAAAVRHVRCEFRSADRSFTIDYGALAGGRSHWVYPQQLLVGDLVEQLLARGGTVLFSHAAVAIEGIDGDSPRLACRAGDGSLVELACDVVAGCDGARGAARLAIPENRRQTYDQRYPFNWLTVLAEASPAPEQVVYAMHPDGFAGQMPRTPDVSRFYLQCGSDDALADWPDARIRTQLRRRLAGPDGAELGAGRILEKGMLAMRSAVTEPMQFGRLYLAGDAAHVLTPCGAKGMNLAIADAAVLAEACIARFRDGSDALLHAYSEVRLPDVWQSQEFSDWLLALIHGPRPDAGALTYEQRLRRARLAQIERSGSFATTFARRYVG
ncbi:MAG: 4-hydroxybenzoate 3-monooxygenase [Solirubrobacteraceae bacterium]|nr:4-hydroxybenzoate 3-monooxygenase [Solirubrobacteraceae bacterium]